MKNKISTSPASIREINPVVQLLISEFGGKINEAKKYVLSKVKSKEIYVLYGKGKILGFMSYAKDYSHGANYLENIIILKSERRKNLAKNLIDKFIEVSKKETLKKQKYALSSTHIDNKISIKMHLKYGFIKLGTIKGLHYGKDEIIFGYKLN